MLPVYKSTYERGDGLDSSMPEATNSADGSFLAPVEAVEGAAGTREQFKVDEIHIILNFFVSLKERMGDGG